MEIEEAEKKCYKKRRYLVVVLAFFGFLIAYTLRTNMNVAIVAMVERKNHTLSNGTVIEKAAFQWSNNEQGLVLSSMFWGYLVSQIPGGYLAMRYSGVLMLGISVSIPGILSLFAPLCAQGSIWLLMTNRILIGLFNGPMFPCANAIWARWAPPKEKSFIVGFVFSGTLVGTIIGNGFSGIVCQKLGWEWAFYIFGIVSVVWSIPWFIFIKERPRKDRFCSEAETIYIESTLKVPTKVKHPIKKMVLSIPVWALCAATTSSDWGFYTLLTQFPTFLKMALKYDVTSSGMLSAVPYAFMCALVNGGGILSDFLINKKILRTIVVRKIFFSLSMIIQSIFIIAAVFVPTAGASVACMAITISCTGLAWAAYFVNHVDIAPPHASIILGITNLFGTLGGIISPILTGLITKNQTLEEWRGVFYVVVGFYIFALIFYDIFARGEIQEWSAKEDEEQKSEEAAKAKK